MKTSARLEFRKARSFHGQMSTFPSQISDLTLVNLFYPPRSCLQRQHSTSFHQKRPVIPPIPLNFTYAVPPSPAPAGLTFPSQVTATANSDLFLFSTSPTSAPFASPLGVGPLGRPYQLTSISGPWYLVCTANRNFFDTLPSNQISTHKSKIRYESTFSSQVPDFFAFFRKTFRVSRLGASLALGIWARGHSVPVNSCPLVPSCGMRGSFRLLICTLFASVVNLRKRETIVCISRFRPWLPT